MKKFQNLGPRLTIKVPSALTKQTPSDIYESRLDAKIILPFTKKQILEKYTMGATINSKFPISRQKKITSQKKNVFQNQSGSKDRDNSKNSYRIKSISRQKLTKSSKIISTINQPKIQTQNKQKKKFQLLYKNEYYKKPPQFKKIQAKGSTIRVIQAIKSQHTQMSEQEPENIQFEEYGFGTNKQLHKYDIGYQGDLTGQQYVQKYSKIDAPHGLVPYYCNGKYKWSEIKLVSYNKQENKYVVALLENKQIKKVNRISLIFKDQNFEIFNQRIKIAKTIQSIAYQELRFLNFVKNIDDNKVSGISRDFKQRINNLFEKNKNQKLVKKLISEVEQIYFLFNKKYLVLLDMEQNESKYEAERIKIRKIIKNYEYPEYRFLNFEDNLHAIKNKHYSQYQNLPKSIGSIIQKSKFLEEYFIFFRPENLLKIKQFEHESIQVLNKNLQIVKKKWRDYLVTQVQFILKKTFELYTINENNLIQPSKYMKIHCELFQYILKTKFYESSFRKWENYIQSFYLPQNDNQIYLYQPKPIIEIELIVNLPERKSPTRRRDKNKEITIMPKQFVSIVPLQKQLLAGFLNPLVYLEQKVKLMQGFESDVFPLKNFKNTISIEKLQSQLIPKLVLKTYQPIYKFIEKMKQYNYLLEEPNFEKLIFEAKTLQKCKQILEVLSNQESIIQQCNIPDYNMVRINLTNFKNTFLDRLAYYKKYLLDKFQSLLIQEIDKLQDTFKQIKQTLNKPPNTEIILVELKNYTNKLEDVLIQLQKKFVLQGKFYNFLEDYFHAYRLNKFEQYCQFVKHPIEIKSLLSQVKANLKSKENKLIQLINQDRQNLSKSIQQLKIQIKIAETLSPFSLHQKNYGQVSRINYQLQTISEKLIDINTRQKLLKQAESIYEGIPKMIKAFEPYYNMWNITNNFENDREDWMHASILNLHYDLIEKKLNNEYYREMVRLYKYFHNNKNIVAYSICEESKKNMEKFREKLWIIQNLTCQGLIKKPNLFKEMFINANIPFIQLKQLNLNAVLQSGLDKCRSIVQQSSSKAEKIWNIEKKINQINQTLRGIELDIIPYKNSETYLVNSSDDVMIVLDDQYNMLIMLKSSPFIKGILTKANNMESKIILIRQTLQILIKCQSSWIYLEPIFRSEDIQKQMPNQKKKFMMVDKTWRMEMQFFKKDTQIWQSLDSESHKNRFQSSYLILEQIQKSLSVYLQEKRKLFPRFYFLSDDELIEILSQTKDPVIINKHINKCFQAINYLHFQDQHLIKAFSSQEGQTLNLLQTIDVNFGENKGNVEIWLKEIEFQMRQCIRQISLKSISDKTPRKQWVLIFPAMTILAANLVKWTYQAEQALRSQSIHDYFSLLTVQLRDIVQLVRTQLSPLERLTLQALVVIDVHNKDIIQKMTLMQNPSITDFQWISQLRYYVQNLPHKKTVRQQFVVKMINASINYCYQYLGNTTRLVITPLTDRCYRTLMGAIDLNYGGAPQGPAGTGKTQTVKDLAKAIAVQCVVFNCSDGLNYLAMTKFFKGLASSGAWCCFDQFNRIDLEVLSVIAQQVLTIQTAIKQKKKVFIFDGQDIVLIRSCAINITMNPGYAGRSELPDNLKALLRPCAMMVPDYSLIGQIYLYSVGFQQARQLSKKIVASLKLSSQQLSSQDHYDFGMRALKSILTAAGALKRNSQQDQNILCLRALLDVNMPKFTKKDMPLFQNITGDLFPGLKLPQNGNYQFLHQLKQISKEQKLDIRVWGLKVEQLWAIIQVRHGLMLVGQTLSGKSTAADTLATIVSIMPHKQFAPTDIIRLNPKSVTTDQLYGRLDPASKSWSDGVLPLIMRKCIQIEDKHFKWITFDGPVDAVWIQNMNTVLDDNKKLCLTSGEIIKLIQGMTMMFQVEDLSQASPATVSRCGMVYLEANMLGWQALIKNIRINQYCKPMKQLIRQESIKQISSLFNMKLKYTIISQYMILVNYFRQLLLIQLNQIQRRKKPLNKQLLSNTIFFTLIWTIGCTFHQDSRNVFHQLAKIYEIKLPNKNSFDYIYNIQKGNWFQWITVENKFILPSSSQIPFNQLIIPTKDTMICGYFFKLYVNNNKNVLFYGPTGTSKSSTVQFNLKNFYNQKSTILQTSFSGQTTAQYVQLLIQSKMTTRKRQNVFGPQQNKEKLVVFIDQVNMPIKQKYGSQPPLELMRQIIQRSSCYDLQTKQTKILQNMIWISSMLPVKTITNRFLRHYQLIYIPAFSQESLQLIFSNIMEWFFNTVQFPFTKQLRALSDKIVGASINLFYEIQQTKQLFPTPQKSHYVYNLRDLAKVFQGIVKVNGKIIKTQVDFISLWYHECRRVFRDRMINQKNIQSYQKIANEVSVKFFKKPDPSIYQQYSYFSQIINNEQYKHESLEDIKLKITETLEQYNSQFNKLNMVLFTTAVQHVIRAVRILSTEGNHLLLIGVGGSGRKSVAKLAVYICFSCQTSVFQDNWEEQVTSIIKTVGIQNRFTSFIIDDRKIINQNIFEDISNLLNRGQIPKLFDNQQKAKLLDEINIQATPVQKYEYFVKQCKKYLHLIICMSPMGKNYRNRLRIFPSLVNCTNIDWFRSWPQEALKQTAQSYLMDVKLQRKKEIIDIFVNMHMNIQKLTQKYKIQFRKYCYVTPTNFLELLRTIKTLLTQRKDNLNKKLKKYQLGVLKIQETQKQVSKMKLQLQELKPKLQKSKKENQVLLVNLKANQYQADIKKKNCEVQQKQCDKQRQQATRLKQECQNDLNNVLPLLQNAAQTLQKITNDDMYQLRSFASPPASAACVMQGLCYIFNEDQNVKPKIMPDNTKVYNFWQYSKKNILNDKLIKRVKQFKINQIRAIYPAKIEKLKTFILQPQFQKNKVFNASKAAGNLSLWVRAVVDTYQALLVVDPKRNQLAQAEKKLKYSEELLKQKKQALAEVMKILQTLKKQYEIARKLKQQLQAKVKKVQIELQRAEKLINGLSSQKQSWKSKSIKLSQQGITIVGDSVLGSGIINYLGPFPYIYREQCIKQWKNQLVQKYNIQISNNFTIQQLYGDMLVISQWTNILKLPNDPVSIDNTIFMKKSRRFPLLIDPQQQALIFIKNIEANKLIVLKPTTPPSQVLFKLQQAIQSGLPILLQNVKEISNIYTPILQKQITNGKLRYNDKFISYSNNFMFYMTTKDQNQHFSPQTCMLVTLLNFSITRVGLTNQLQNILLTSLYPVQSTTLAGTYIQISSLSHKLIEIENEILSLLQNTVNILSDDKLIETLETSKSSNVQVEQRLKKCEQNKKQIQLIKKSLFNQSDIYSSWYFVTQSFVFLESVYRWSLDGYKGLLIKVLQSTKQLSVINKTLFDMYFKYINRSLFQKDKLVFIFLIALGNCVREGRVKSKDIRIMMVGPTGNISNKKKKTLSDISINHWNSLLELEQNCEPLNNITSNEKLITQIINANSIKQCTFEFSYFYFLLMVRFLRPEKFTQIVYQFIKKEVGQKYLQSPPFDLLSAFKQSKTDVPIIFLLTTGADPRYQLLNLAETQGMKNNVEYISLGQGQKDFALKSIQRGMQEGYWILLQNCHLSPSFMPELEKYLENFGNKICNERYRLFLTSMPTDVFPVNVLTASIKLSYQPPGSLKNNLIRLFSSVNPKQFEQNSQNIKKIMFNLSFFHSILLQRRRFGPIGWNIPYQFTNSDFQISFSAIKVFINQYESPWKIINYMIGQAYYGGRVTDPMDRRFLMTLLQDFMNENALSDSYLIQNKYKVPAIKSINEYLNQVNTYGLVQNTQLYGLHQNASITSQILKTKQICLSILSILPQQSQGQKPILNLLQQVLNKLPEAPAASFIKNHPIKYQQSINTVLHQQLERYQKLYNRIQKDLKQLIQAEKGQIQSTAQMQQITRSILQNRVPKGWGIGSLSFWLILFNTQIKFLNSWLKQGQPKSFLLPSFIFPQGFFTAVLQNYSRKYKISVDKLRFQFKVFSKYQSEKQIQAIEDSNFIHGLILQGARWNKNQDFLQQQRLNQLSYSMPYIMIKPTVQQKIISDEFYSCPVYKNSQRRGILSTTGHSSNFILQIDLKTKQKPKIWCLRGVAMIASI